MINEELQEKLEQLASSIDWIKTKLFDLQEEKGLAPVKTPYEVEVPEDVDDYYISDKYGEIYTLDGFSREFVCSHYQRGLAFKTREEAEQYDKERILINKFKDWAKKYNGGWTPNWKDFEEKQYYVVYDFEDKKFYVRYEHYSETFTKLPYFKSEEIAQQFIEEFGEEIKEVLC